jgi:SAM-dependent methyltransferase
MCGVLFDLPHVVEGAPEVLARWGVQDRVKLAGGSFFESLPEGVDACILSTVIHDWDDERSIKILQNCHRATKPGGKLLLAEMVIPDSPEPTPGKFLDLNMLVMTPGGRERTAGEYAALYEKCGFRLTRIVPTPSPVSVVEGVRID